MCTVRACQAEVDKWEEKVKRGLIAGMTGEGGFTGTVPRWQVYGRVLGLTTWSLCAQFWPLIDIAVVVVRPRRRCAPEYGSKRARPRRRQRPCPPR